VNDVEPEPTLPALSVAVALSVVLGSVHAGAFTFVQVVDATSEVASGAEHVKPPTVGVTGPAVVARFEIVKPAPQSRDRRATAPTAPRCCRATDSSHSDPLR
jgi:hypothetical protein